MTAVVLPIDADPATGLPSYTAQQTREAFAAFLSWAPSGRPLGANSGVRQGTPANTVTSTSTTWSCGAHAGVVDAESSAAAGPYLYATDGTDSGSVTAADPTNPRVDIVYVKINDTVQDGSGLRSGQVLYLAGTPAGSPTAPATPARSLLLATLAVPASGGGSPTVTWAASTYGVLARGRIDKTNSQNVPNTTDTQVTYQSSHAAETTLAGMNDAANNRLICQVPGLHRIDAAVPWDGTSGGFREVKIEVNGSVIVQDKRSGGSAWGAAGGSPQLVSCMATLAKGDLLTVVVTQNQGAAVNLDATAGVIGYLAAVCMGP